jgi:hypothetical protein
MDNHTQGSAYFRQFFKRPLVADCDCVACSSQMFGPMIMPLAAYEELHNNFSMPLPIPKPASVAIVSDPHYMTFDEAVKHPFTDVHKPSLQNRRRNNNTVVGGNVSLGEREIRTSSEAETNKVTQGKCIRDIVSCKDCMKPRCLYSAILPNRMKPAACNGDPEPTAQGIRLCREYSMGNFDEIQNSDYYVCGVQPFDADDPMYGVIIAREGLECHHHVEFEY